MSFEPNLARITKLHYCLNGGDTMAITFRKLDPSKVLKLKRQGLSNSQIAQRLGVTQGAVYHVLRKTDLRKLETMPA